MTGHPQSSRRQRQKRVIACEACRGRRTRCDGGRPSCASCDSRGVPCQYPAINETKDSPAANCVPSGVTEDITAIRAQLDRMENMLQTQCAPKASTSIHSCPSTPVRTIDARSCTTSNLNPSGESFPFISIQNSAFTRLTGLGPDYGRHILVHEQQQGNGKIDCRAVGPFMMQKTEIDLCVLTESDANVQR